MTAGRGRHSPSGTESGSTAHAMAFPITQRQRSWLDALIILSTVAVGFVVIGFIADVFYSFGDIILIFFLAWLLAFILSPIVARLTNVVPILPRLGAAILVYALLVGGLILVAILVAGALAKSITDFFNNVPQLQTQLPQIVAPWQERLNALGLSNVNLLAQTQGFINNLNHYAEQLAGPLQQLAVASLSAIGSLLLVLILSLYIVVDRDRIMSFWFRMIPPAFTEDAVLLETSVARSFGGFLRGQALLGLVYGLVAVLTSAILGLAYLPVTSVLAGLLMAIPFFGPFVSWVPPVLVAILVQPSATLPAIIVMGVGWFLVMNVLQPRVMAGAVGIHPIVVLGSVLIGSKMAGIIGAIFGIPIAAVISAFFFQYVRRVRDEGPVSARAARRVSAREGREVRVPREPAAGVDPDVDDAHRTQPGRTGRPSRPTRPATRPTE
ncbi:MAG: AI-2E family transporter [Chloroflexi bacterium]|nr:MAG: AI-2E family transporter [Chloroflexota bacterium]